jgi:hypothetical protein
VEQELELLAELIGNEKAIALKPFVQDPSSLKDGSFVTDVIDLIL